MSNLNQTTNHASQTTPVCDKGLVKMPTATSVEGAPLGLDEGSNPVVLTAQELAKHGICLGSTGSGKTVTLKNIIGGAVDLGWTVVVLDFKQDLAPAGLREYCRDTAKLHQLDYQELLLAEPQVATENTPPFWFNALQGLDEHAAVDVIFSLLEFDDYHWRAITRRVVQQTCNLFYRTHELNPSRWSAPNLLEIGKALAEGAGSARVKERLEVVAKLTGVDAMKSYRSLVAPTKDEASVHSAGAALVRLFETSVGKRTLAWGAAPRELSLAATEGVVYMGLNSSEFSALAKVVSTSALAQLDALASQVIRQMRPKTKTLIIVDEAWALHLPQLKNLLARGNTAGFSVWLATQNASDLICSDDGWSPLLQAGCGVILQQKELQSAELVSKFLASTPPSDLDLCNLEAYIKSNWRPPTFVRLGIRTSDGDWIWPQRAQIPQ